MKSLFVLALLYFGNSLLFNFSNESECNNWRVINDGVMGGLSQGKVVYEKDKLVFTGTISLRNNGGFSSLKSPFDYYDISDYSKLKIRYRSEGVKMAMTMETSRYFYNPYFKYELANSSSWKEIVIDLKDFKENRLGRETGNKLMQSDKSDIIRLGFINQEKKEQNFKLEIDYIKFLK